MSHFLCHDDICCITPFTQMVFVTILAAIVDAPDLSDFVNLSMTSKQLVSDSIATLLWFSRTAELTAM